MQWCKTLLVGLVASALLSGCVSEKDSVVMSPLPQVQSQFTPKTVWKKSVGSGIDKYYSNLAPAWDDGIVYAADRKGIVKAFEADGGKELWSIDLSTHTGFLSSNVSALLSGGVTTEGDTVYIGSENAKLYALNKADGKLAWVATVAGEVNSHPVISDGIVLIHTSNGMLQALDVSTGSVKWSLNLGSPTLSVRGESSPIIAYGAAIIGGDNGTVSAVMVNQGQLIWQQRISQISSSTEIGRLNDVDMTPIVDEGVVYAIAYNGQLTALDMRSGQIMWKRDLGSINDMVLAGDTLYLVDQNDRILAVRKNDGVTLWTQEELLHRNLTAPEIYNGYVVVGDSEGYLHWLDTANGTFVAQNRVDSSGLAARPVIASDKLLLQARDGTLHLITR